MEGHACMYGICSRARRPSGGLHGFVVAVIWIFMPRLARDGGLERRPEAVWTAGAKEPPRLCFGVLKVLAKSCRINIPEFGSLATCQPRSMFRQPGLESWCWGGVVAFDLGMVERRTGRGQEQWLFFQYLSWNSLKMFGKPTAAFVTRGPRGRINFPSLRRYFATVSVYSVHFPPRLTDAGTVGAPQ